MPRLPSAVLAALLGCCTTRPEPVTAAADHTHRITTTVTVTDRQLLPAAEVRIPAFSTIVWRNGSSAPLQVDIDAVACGQCETVLGFRPGDHGARSAAIAPGAVATICFHDQGTFPFVARLGGGELRGTIRVGDPR